MAERPFPPGARVRHYSQQYFEALVGTATVLHAEAQPTGGWEYLVQRDRPIFPDGSNGPTWWASYHVEPAMRPFTGEDPTPEELAEDQRAADFAADVRAGMTYTNAVIKHYADAS